MGYFTITANVNGVEVFPQFASSDIRTDDAFAFADTIVSEGYATEWDAIDLAIHFVNADGVSVETTIL